MTENQKDPLVKKEKVIEGNKLIAEFMGAKPDGGSTAADDGTMAESYELEFGEVQLCYYNKITVNKYTADVCSLRFDFSWKWLMPVVEKICRMKIGDGKTYVEYATPRTFGMLSDEDGKIMVRLNGFTLHKADTLIEATWQAVVEFIEHNKNEIEHGKNNNSTNEQGS